MPPRRPEDARRTHSIDQLGGISRDLAVPVAAFYRALRADKIERDDAIALTGEYLRQLLADLRDR